MRQSRCWKVASFRDRGAAKSTKVETSGYEANGQPYQDWCTEQAHQLGPDPMARQPAPRLADAPDERVVSFTYRYDWREVGVARGGESLGAGRGEGQRARSPQRGGLDARRSE